MRPLTIESVNENVVRGQYTAAKGMNGYLQEINVPQDSFTETYVAIKAEIENDRWKGVPFYLRTGKRMAGKVAEIVLNFRPLQNHIFENSQAAPNRLVIELQPTESVRLYTQMKTPGAGNKVEIVPLAADLEKSSKAAAPKLTNACCWMSSTASSPSSTAATNLKLLGNM